MQKECDNSENPKNAADFDKEGSIVQLRIEKESSEESAIHN